MLVTSTPNCPLGGAASRPMPTVSRYPPWCVITRWLRAQLASQTRPRPSWISCSSTTPLLSTTVLSCLQLPTTALLSFGFSWMCGSASIFKTQSILQLLGLQACWPSQSKQVSWNGWLVTCLHRYWRFCCRQLMGKHPALVNGKVIPSRNCVSSRQHNKPWFNSYLGFLRWKRNRLFSRLKLLDRDHPTLIENFGTCMFRSCDSPNVNTTKNKSLLSNPAAWYMTLIAGGKRLNRVWHSVISLNTVSVSWWLYERHAWGESGLFKLRFCSTV